MTKKSDKLADIFTFLGIMFIIGALVLLMFFPKLTKDVSSRDLNFKPQENISPINVLVVGLDKVGQNTDTILVINYNPNKKKVNIVSIPRDTLVRINGNPDKINAAYAKGNISLLEHLCEQILDINIDNYVIINTQGFVKIVNTLGGVYVDVPRDLKYTDNSQGLYINLKKGRQLLNGGQAEQYMRYRHGYTNGDLGRVEAQQAFFKAFIAQKLSLRYISKIDDVLSEIFQNVKTDIHITEAIKYIKYAKDYNNQNFNFITLPGKPKTLNALSYYIYDIDETYNVMQNIKDLN